MTSAPPRSAWPSRRGAVSFTAALVLAASLAGCAPAETGLQADAARQLQARVLHVSEAAAASDRDAALKALDALEADLTTSAGKGEISLERQRRIAAVIAAVRADLTGIQFAVQSAAVKPHDDEPASAGTETVQQPGYAPVAPEPAPIIPAPIAQEARPAPAPVEPAPASSDTNNGNQGNGNGNRGNEGKGKGHGS